MSLTDEISAHLAEHGPAGASDIAQALGRDAGTVARMLGKLRANGRVTLDDAGVATVAGSKRGRAAPDPEPEAQPDRGDDAAADLAADPAVPARFWVYSDRTVGIGIGGTALELSQEQLQQFVDFLAGVRPLLEREPT